MSAVQKSGEMAGTQTPIGTEDFLDIIRTYVSLEGNPETPSGYCPICHGDGQTFQVHPVSQKWRCARCRRSGDIYDFIGNLRHVSRDDAVRFVEILSHSRTSDFSHTAQRKKRKPPKLVKSPPASAKPPPPAKRDNGDRVPTAGKRKKSAAGVRKTKKASANISLVAENSSPSPKRTEVVEPEPEALAPIDESPLSTTPALDFSQNLLAKFEFKSDVMGLALIARDEDQEVLRSTIPELAERDIQILDTLVKDALRHSMRIVGEFDANQIDIVFVMNTTFKAAATKLLWIPVDKPPFHCNVLFMLKEDAHEPILLMQLRKFFQ